MTLIELLVFLLIAGVCGAAGQALAGYSRGGCLASVAVGFLGALLGSWIAGLLGFSEILAVEVGGRPFPVVWSILGATLLVVALGFVAPRRR